MQPDDQSEEKIKKMRLLVSNSLRLGVLLSTAIVVIGLTEMVVSGQTGYECDLSSLNCLLGNSSGVSGVYPVSLVQIFQGLGSAKPYSIIELGAIVLIATPVIRVITSVGLFSVEKDRTFVIITMLVFFVLLFSFFVVPFIPIFRA